MCRPVVRPGGLDDLPELTRIYNHYVEHSIVTFDVEPFSVEQHRSWFDQYAETGPHRLLVAELDRAIGATRQAAPFGRSPAM